MRNFKILILYRINIQTSQISKFWNGTKETLGYFIEFLKFQNFEEKNSHSKIFISKHFEYLC